MLRSCLAAVVLLSLVAAPALSRRAAAAPPDSPQPPLEEAIASARVAGKPLVIDFYTDWCKPCRMFEDKILPDARVQAALADVMFMRYDAEKGNGIAAATRFRVDAYPTFVVIDGQGKAIARTSGAPDEPTPFLRFIDRGVALSLDQATVATRLADKKLDARHLLGAARWLAAHRRLDEAVVAYARAAKADKGGKLGIAPVAEWEAFAIEHHRQHRRKMVDDAAAFAERWPASEEGADAALVAIRSGLLPDPRRKKLWDLVLKKSWSEAAALNQLAYTALATGDLGPALDAARRAVELSPKDASVYDTLAEVLHYRGEKDKALAASDQAIALNQDARMDALLKANRARFAGPDVGPSDEVEAEKARGPRELDAWLRGGGEEAADVAEDTPPSPAEAARIEAEAQMRGLQIAASGAFKAASGKCAAQAGQLPEVYVRIELAAVGGKPTRVVVLEPAAPAPLKKCLTDALASVSFPVAPAATNGRYTGAVKFGAGGKPH